MWELPLAGGAADKAGNRFERRWTVAALLDVLEGKAESFQVEVPGDVGAVPALILGALVAAFEVFAGPNTVFAVSAVLLLSAAAPAAAAQGRRHRLWSNLLALEVAYGIPDIDELADTGSTPTA